MIQIIVISILIILFFWLQGKVYSRLWDKDLNVTIKFANHEVFEGDESSLLEIIENQKKLPLTMINVKFQTDRNLLFEDEKGASKTDQFYRNDIFQINGFEKITRTLQFTAGKRGYYRIEHADLVGTDLLMKDRYFGSSDNYTSIYVYPKLFRSKEMQLSLNQLNGEILSKRNLLEDPFEYRGIREYQPYDDMRTINWKATAKTGELKVNQKNETSLKEVRIFINTEDNGVLKKDDCVEAGFQIAAGLSKYLTDQGMRISCYSNAQDIISAQPLIIESNSGKSHLNKIYRNLARIDLEKTGKGFVELFSDKVLTGKHELITIFISSNQYDDYTDLLHKYQMQGGSFIWYFPVWELDDPKVPEALRKNIRFIHIR